MLDCGEGTINQLHRKYGRKGAQEVLRGLRALYVSHPHADHHFGLISLVTERERAFIDLGQPTEKLLILAPKKMAVFWSMYHGKFEDILTHLMQIRLEHLLPFTPTDDTDVELPIKKEDDVLHPSKFPNDLKECERGLAKCPELRTTRLYPYVMEIIKETLGTILKLNNCTFLDVYVFIIGTPPSFQVCMLPDDCSIMDFSE